MRAKHFFIATVATAAIVTGAWLSFQEAQTPSPPITATVLPQPVDLAKFSLIDHRSQPFTAAEFAGQWDLVFFGFTNCPDICPLTLKVLADARTLADVGDTRVVLVSVDPERDTPDNLARYVGHFGDNIIGLTGELDQLRALTGSLGIWFEKEPSDNEHYNVNHSAAVIVVDPDGKFHAVFTAPHVAENIAADMQSLMALAK
ncbi:MAG: SCO family protein [Pseudomonadota bacterium]